MAYLPDWSVGKREPDRDFIWTVIFNVQPDYHKELLAQAINIRARARKVNTVALKPIEINTNAVNELLRGPDLNLGK